MEQDPYTAAKLVLFGTLAGSLLGVCGTLATTYLQHYFTSAAEEKKQRIANLQDTFRAIAELEEWIEAYTNHKLFRGAVPPSSPLAYIDTQVALYYPALDGLLTRARLASIRYTQWVLGVAQAQLANPSGGPDISGYEAAYGPFSLAVSALRDALKEEARKQPERGGTAWVGKFWPKGQK